MIVKYLPHTKDNGGFHQDLYQAHQFTMLPAYPFNAASMDMARSILSLNTR